MIKKTTMSQRSGAVLLILSLATARCVADARGAEAPAPKADGAAASAPGPTPSHLTAKQIVANNVKARGGLDAWRKIQTMVSIGHLETGNPAVPRVPFVLQQARPDKMRFEVHVHDKTSIRVFNGVEGWKLRSARGGNPELLAYTAEEIVSARDGPGIDGPLIDYQAKGIGIDFDGIDEVAGKRTYRLNVKLPSGAMRRWWIDAASFLDVKYERESRTPTGQPATVTVSFADYRSINGLQIPYSIINGQESGTGTGAMVIEQMFLNQPLGDRDFSKPHMPTRIYSPNAVPSAR